MIAWGRVFAQEDPVIAESEDVFVEKLRRLQPRPKFLEFHYSALGNFRVKANSEIFGNPTVSLRSNQRFNSSLRFPVSLKPESIIIGGLTFRQESFHFVNIEPGDAIFPNLDQSSLTVVGLSTIWKKSFSERFFLFGFWNASLNSDDISFSSFRDQLKTTLVLVAVRNSTPIKQFGIGGGFGYIFGRAAVFPVFIYNETYSYKWHLEALLPKSVKLRYTLNPETHFYFINHLSGASYFIRERKFAGFDKLSFRRSSFASLFSMEREIYDFLWMGLSAGYNLPVNLYISEPRDRRRDSLITFDVEPSPFFDISLFLVVPKKIHFKDAKSR